MRARIFSTLPPANKKRTYAIGKHKFIKDIDQPIKKGFRLI